MLNCRTQLGGTREFIIAPATTTQVISDSSTLNPSFSQLSQHRYYFEHTKQPDYEDAIKEAFDSQASTADESRELCELFGLDAGGRHP